MTYAKPNFRHPDLPLNEMDMLEKNMRELYLHYVQDVAMIPYPVPSFRLVMSLPLSRTDWQNYPGSVVPQKPLPTF